ncbi:MAG: T9SS type A sorting domain-containing protein [Candidatus Cloacimonetes bacterium]|nr:T9SS type A sorting domain-containing protein [Candidatus Cloacimonadota bacterium]MBT6994187.1 T9SS type A sorting domain-containing protein [Candidatus Cloacimonadota bacterium]
MKKVLLALAVLFLAVCAFTITINVPADYETIQAGINAATEGDSVLVAAGIYYENIVWPVVNGIKLIGESEETTIIDGNALANVIYFNSSNIDTTTLTTNFTIQNGSSDYGGGIRCEESSPNLTNITITCNSAVDYGGGISCRYSSNPSLENVTFTNNSANHGGGLYCFYSSNPSLENVTFTNNSAADYGGGIHCGYNANPSLENVIITNNFAYSRGGGLYCAENSSLSFSAINRCDIYSNNVENRGSGADIYSGSTISVILDTFTVINPTDYHASPLNNFTFDILNAAITEQIDADLYVSPNGDNANDGLTAQTPLKTIQYANSIILADSNNPRTIYLANGVYSPSTNGEYFPVEMISYVSLIGESEEGTILNAEDVAGVIRCRDINSATISNLTVTGGMTVYYGGGIYCYNSNPSLENITIKNNFAELDGGGIYCSNNSSPSLENVTIRYNSAVDDGGGICCLSFSNPNLVNVTIANNSALNGGGIYCYGSGLSLTNCILWNDSPQEIYGYGTIVSYSNIQGGWEGEGNIDTDPLFVDAENGDYHLLADSPCIDAGTAYFEWDGEVLVDMAEDEYYGIAPDMGALEWEGVSTEEETILPIINNYNLTNHPNPFNPSTTISFSLTTNLHENTRIEIFNIKGQLVKQLVVNPESVRDGLGNQQIIWNANKFANGVYFYKLVVDGKAIDTKKMILLK